MDLPGLAVNIAGVSILLSAHVVVIDEEALHSEVLTAVHDTITRHFKIAHVTLRIERPGWRECESHLHKHSLRLIHTLRGIE